jgi:foldase protein PrsA
VAKRYSIDAESKDNGGKLAVQEEGTLERRLEKAVFGARKGPLVGPVHTRYGYYVFTVTRIEPARQPSFAEVKPLIVETLAAEAEQAALDAFVQDFTARWRARTECAEGYRTSDCRNGPAPRG